MAQSKINAPTLVGVSCFYGVLSVVGVVAMYYPTLVSHFTRIQSELGDTRLIQYFLEHSFQVLTNRSYVGSLWSPPFFYPFKNAFALSENLLGSAPIYWALRSMVSSDLAFQLWMMIVTWLCFVAFVVVSRRFRVSHALAGFGGFLFAFGLTRAAKIGHFQLFPQFFLPFAVLSVWDFTQKPTPNRLRWSLILIYLQVLAGIYLGWFLIFSLLIFVPAILYFDRAVRTQVLQYFRTEWKSSAIAGFAWLTAMIFLFLPYIKMTAIIGKRPYSEVATMLPRLTSWLLPAPQSIWGRVLSRLGHRTPMVHEHWLFLGFVILGLFGFALYILRSRTSVMSSERVLLVSACFVTCLVIFLLSLSVFGVSLWWFVYKLFPGANSIRAVTRISLTLYFYLLLGTLLCVDSFLKSTVAKPSIRNAIAIGLLLLTLPEQIVWNAPSFDRAEVFKTESELQELMSKGCNLAYVQIRPEETFYSQQIYAMWAGLRSNIPVINGYTGANPPGLEMTKNVEFPELLNWLHTASRGTAKGQLCLIQATTKQNQIDRAISFTSIQNAQQFRSSTGRLTAFTIPVPPNTPLQDYDQGIRLLTQIPAKLPVNAEVNLPVLVRNTGEFTWFNSGNAPVNLSYHWANEQSQIVPSVSERAVLPFNLLPGQAIALNAKVTAPNRAGRYTLQLSMVQESVAWFDAKTKPLSVPIQIVSESSF